MILDRNATKLIKFIWVPMVLSACVGGESASSSTPATSGNAKTSLSTSSQSSSNSGEPVYIIGGTYDTMSAHPTDTMTCLNIGGNTDYMIVDSPKAALTFTSSIDSTTVQSALGREFTAKYGWGPFEVTISHQYARSTEDDDFTMNMNYAYQYFGVARFKSGELAQGNAALTPAAASIIESDPEGFRTMCGDEFVSELSAGLSVLMRVTLKFNSHSQKDAFDDSFNDAPGLSDVLSSIKNDTSGIKYNLSVAGIQVGGDPEQLNNLFFKYGGYIGNDGYPVLECTQDTPTNISESCTAVINEVITYATNVADQIKSIEDYNLYNPIKEPWGQLGVYPGATNPDQATEDAMQDLLWQFGVDQDTLEFLNNYHNMLGTYTLLSVGMDADLLKLIDEYNQVLDIYNDPENNLVNCYNGYVSTQCVDIRDNIFAKRSKVLSDERLNALLFYIQSKQYTSDLRDSNDMVYINTVGCELAPISEESQSQYLIDCKGSVSGSLDPLVATKIKYDPVYDVLDVQNFYYTVPGAESTSAPLNFYYLTYQSLLPDIYYPNAWSGKFKVLFNGVDVGVEDELILTNRSL